MSDQAVFTQSIEIAVDGYTGVLLIATDSNGFILGTVQIDYGKSGQEPYIIKLFVAEAYRRKGIGSILVHECIKTVSNKNYQVIALTVEPGNDSILPFYQKLGFRLAYRYEDRSRMLVYYLK